MSKPNYLEILQSARYDPAEIVPQEHTIISIEGKTIGTLQNIVTISGLPKQGKTRYSGAIIAAALTGDEIFGIKVALPKKRFKVAYFDTEQGKYDFNRTIKYIETLSNGYYDSLFAYNTREFYPQQQLALIETFVNHNPECCLLFLDGILDLLDSFNDERESIRLVRLLKKWTKEKDMLVVNVLHRKKDGSNTLGQIGSAIDRVSQSVLTVEKNKERNTYILKPEFLRSAEDFTPCEIYYNKNAEQWQQTFSEPDNEEKKIIKILKLKPQEIIIEEHRANVVRIFNSKCPQTYDELRQSVKEFYQAGKTWAEECIRHLFNEQLIFRVNNTWTNDRQQQLYAKK